MSAEELGVSVGEAQQQQLLDYAALVKKWNRSINLVSRQDIDRLWNRHVMDSLSAHRYLHGTSVLDVGTGAGLPGIPLAVVNAERQFVLCDRMAKRIRFLQVVKSQLRLSNVELLEQDFANNKAWESGFDSILARAVAPAASLWPMLEPALNDGGRLLVFRSTRAAFAETEERGQEAQIAYHRRTEHAAIPGLEQVHFLEILERR